MMRKAGMEREMDDFRDVSGLQFSFVAVMDNELGVIDPWRQLACADNMDVVYRPSKSTQKRARRKPSLKSSARCVRTSSRSTLLHSKNLSQTSMFSSIFKGSSIASTSSVSISVRSLIVQT